MKFQLKEGQWFDVRKLTDWQKQWCLDNLDWVSSCSKNQIKRDQYHLALYNTFGSTLKRFGTTSKTYVQPENEITFNDFYWGENEEVSQESIFDNPRWVTCCNDSLGQVTLGKDYKVVNVNNDNYTIIMDKGIEGSLHKNRFHKVTPQDLLPEEVEESFDNLEFIKPNLGQFNHWMIKLEHLSKEQLDFISTYWKTDFRFKPDRSDQNVVMSMNEGYDSNFVWTNNTNNFMPDLRSHYFSFNQLFQEVN